MPTSTDLVTDLPADFEVFGQAVDTSMADLKGGTTGQILSKATNADMDFVWTSANPGDITGITATSPLTGGGTSGDVTVGIQAASTTQSGAVQLTNSVSSTSITTAAVPANVKTAYDLAAAAVPLSTVTTNGDLIYGTGVSTVTRRAIGTTGQVLTVSGGVPTWTTPSSGGMTAIASGTLTGSSISLTSIPSTYNSLMLTLNGFSMSSNAQIRVRLNNVTGTSYNYSTFYGGTSTGVAGSIATADWLMNYADAAAAQSNQTLILQIPMYEAATSNNIVATSWCAYRNNASANWQIDQTNLNMISTSGTINRIDVQANYSGAYTFDAGTYTLWGIK